MIFPLYPAQTQQILILGIIGIFKFFSQVVLFQFFLEPVRKAEKGN